MQSASDHALSVRSRCIFIPALNNAVSPRTNWICRSTTVRLITSWHRLRIDALESALNVSSSTYSVVAIGSEIAASHRSARLCSASFGLTNATNHPVSAKIMIVWVSRKDSDRARWPDRWAVFQAAEADFQSIAPTQPANLAASCPPNHAPQPAADNPQADQPPRQAPAPCHRNGLGSIAS